MADDCACSFVMRHAAENFQRALSIANVDPPDCPFGPGLLAVRSFVMDYRELPTNGVFGTFQANIYVVFEEQRRVCFKIIVSFDQGNGEDSEEEDGIPKFHLL